MKKQKNREKNRKKRKRLLWLENIYIWLKQVTLLNGAKTSHKKCLRQRNERINIFLFIQNKTSKKKMQIPNLNIRSSTVTVWKTIELKRIEKVFVLKKGIESKFIERKKIINTNEPNSAKLSKAKSQRE